MQQPIFNLWQLNKFFPLATQMHSSAFSIPVPSSPFEILLPAFTVLPLLYLQHSIRRNTAQPEVSVHQRPEPQKLQPSSWLYYVIDEVTCWNCAVDYAYHGLIDVVGEGVGRCEVVDDCDAKLFAINVWRKPIADLRCLFWVNSAADVYTPSRAAHWRHDRLHSVGACDKDYLVGWGHGG